MDREKRVLVYLANGVQGGAVARQAVNRGYRVRALVRDPGKSDLLRKLGVEVAAADLENRAILDEAHHGMDYAVFQMPLGPLSQIEPLIDNAIASIKMSGVKGVVVKMGSGKPAIQTEVPAFVLNRIIEEKMRDSRIRFSIIRPTMYLDNFLRPDIRAGISKSGVIVYALPARQKIAWTCTDDVANAALTLLENEIFGADEIVSGVNAVDGEGLASAFSTALNRDIRFQSLALETVEDSVTVPIGKRLATATLRFIQDHPDEASKFLSRQFSPSPQLRNFCPTLIQTWIREHSVLFT